MGLSSFRFGTVLAKGVENDSAAYREAADCAERERLRKSHSEGENGREERGPREYDAQNVEPDRRTHRPGLVIVAQSQLHQDGSGADQRHDYDGGRTAKCRRAGKQYHQNQRATKKSGRNYGSTSPGDGHSSSDIVCQKHDALRP